VWVVTEEGHESKGSNSYPFKALNVMEYRLPSDVAPQHIGSEWGKEPGYGSNGLIDCCKERIEGGCNAPVRVPVRVNISSNVSGVVSLVHHPVAHVEFLKPIHSSKDVHGTGDCESMLLCLGHVRYGSALIDFSLEDVKMQFPYQSAHT
jgi:hypothetical protein